MMKIVILLLVIAVAFILYVRFLERTMLFAPSRAINQTPEDIGLLYRDVTFVSSDGVKLNGWFILAPRSLNPSGLLGETKRYTLLFFHGNAGNIADRLEKIRLFHELGLNVFIMDYRGYGRSEGRPTEKGMYLDALAAYDHLVKNEKIRPDEIIDYGASLGGAAAIDLASKREVRCLIADSTFSNAADMAKTIIAFVPSLVLSIKLDSLDKIQKITVPKLFVHSPQDQTVPYVLGKKLFNAAPEPKTFLDISGDHNDGNFDTEGVFAEGIKKFLLSAGIKI